MLPTSTAPSFLATISDVMGTGEIAKLIYILGGTFLLFFIIIRLTHALSNKERIDDYKGVYDDE